MKNKTTSIFLLLAITLLLPIISAASTAIPDYTFQYDTEADFRFSCDSDGVPCNASLVDCFITLRAPDNGAIVDHAPMTILDNGDAQYLIPGDAIEIISPIYSGKVYCTNGVIGNTETFVMEINGTGENRDATLFIILAIASILILGLAMAAENEYIGFMGGALFILTGMYSLIYGIGNLANMYTQSISFIAMGLGFLFLIAAGYKAMGNGEVSFGSRHYLKDKEQF